MSQMLLRVSSEGCTTTRPSRVPVAGQSSSYDTHTCMGARTSSPRGQKWFIHRQLMGNKTEVRVTLWSCRTSVIVPENDCRCGFYHWVVSASDPWLVGVWEPFWPEKVLWAWNFHTANLAPAQFWRTGVP